MLENQTIDAETCVNRIRSLRSARPTEEEEHCRVCSKEYELICNRYKPVSRAEYPLRRGAAVLLFLF